MNVQNKIKNETLPSKGNILLSLDSSKCHLLPPSSTTATTYIIASTTPGFKKLAESGMTRSSHIRLDADCDEFDTRYILYLDLALNWLDSDDSTDIPS